MVESSYPIETIEVLTLRDGTQFTLRPILPEDAPRLQEGFAHLSPQSIYMRFLQSFIELSDEQARQFATVDYHTRMALVGSIQEDGEERLVAVARYAMVGSDRPGVAEAAIVVRDDYHNRGLGSLALDRLIRYARQQGVTDLLAMVNVGNVQIIHFIQRSGLAFERTVLEPGTWEILINIKQEHE